MSYKLLVLDIDGTVTNSKKEITPKTKEAILELQKKGIPVAIASGRPTKGIVAVTDFFLLSNMLLYIGNICCLPSVSIQRKSGGT